MSKTNVQPATPVLAGTGKVGIALDDQRVDYLKMKVGDLIAACGDNPDKWTEAYFQRLEHVGGHVTRDSMRGFFSILVQADSLENVADLTDEISALKKTCSELETELTDAQNARDAAENELMAAKDRLAQADAGPATPERAAKAEKLRKAMAKAAGLPQTAGYDEIEDALAKEGAIIELGAGATE